MDPLQMCGEEILRLAASRRNGMRVKPILRGDAVFELVRAALDAAKPVGVIALSPSRFAPRRPRAYALSAK